MNKRILIIVQNAPVEGDKRIQRELEALTAAGYQASLICPDRRMPIPRLTMENVDISRFKPTYSGRGFLSYIAEYLLSFFRIFVLVTKEHSRVGFDAIQACNPPDMFFVLGALFRVFGVRFVFDQHDPSPEIYLSRFARPRRLVYKLMRFMEYMTYRVADVILVTNESAKAAAIARGHVAAERVFVVRNGPYLAPSDPVQTCPEVRSEGHKYVVCCMGWIAMQDGVDNLIEAAYHLIHVRKRDDICFLIVGDGTELKQLKEKTKAMGIAHHVVFTGYVTSGSLLRGYLKMADICVSPEPQSLCNEKMTFIKVLDYMAAGKPIVAFDLPETRASAAQAALYACPNDITDLAAKISLLLDSPELRSSMGRYGLKRVKQSLLWDHARGNFLKAYAALFEQTTLPAEESARVFASPNEAPPSEGDCSETKETECKSSV